jgi:DNA (cytosine-5)-methyltransferase 1
VITVTDLLCGAGGSGLGAGAVQAVELAMAANHWHPAVAVIDWSDPGGRIGDHTPDQGRARPLRDAATGSRGRHLERRHHTRERAVPRPHHPRNRRPLVLLEARDGKHARPAEAPTRTQSTRAETALVVPYYRTGTARPAGEPLPTLRTVETAGLAFIQPGLPEGAK